MRYDKLNKYGYRLDKMNKILNRNLNKLQKTLSISFIKIGKMVEKRLSQKFI